MANTDPQGKSLYKWENEFFNDDPEISMEQCRDLVHTIFSPLTPPLVTEGKTAKGNRKAITLPTWARKPHIVIHECVHGWLRTIDHGPKFVRQYVTFLTEYHNQDGTNLEESLAEHGIKIAEAEPYQ